MIYENVGHIAMEEVPAESAAEVRAFMAQVTAQPQAAVPPIVLCGEVGAVAEGAVLPEPFRCGG
ncbi:MAG TPA: hypothetical protein DD437_03150 [Rhodobiaceae bacterium]|nr:hypothetical protein [Rhodobiaceae bacterium]